MRRERYTRRKGSRGSFSTKDSPKPSPKVEATLRNAQTKVQTKTRKKGPEIRGLVSRAVKFRQPTRLRKPGVSRSPASLVK